MVNQLTELEAKEILLPHLPTLERVMTESLEDLNKALSTLTETANKRAKSALLHSIAIEKAKKYFDGIAGVAIKCKYQSMQIVFSNKIVGRIKKVNKDNLSANAKTKRNNAILNQQTTLFGDLFFDDIAPSTFVDLGYNLDETGSEYNKLNVVCRKQKAVDWYFNFKGIEKTIVISTEQIEPLDIKEEKQIKIRKAK